MSEIHGPFIGTIPFAHRDVAEFLREGLLKNDPVIVIAMPTTRLALEAELAALGIQLAHKETQGLACCVDSETVLKRVLVNGLPDRVRFESVVDEVLAVSRITNGRRVRAYHDLVDVLHKLGARDAAVMVQKIWDEICERHGDLVLAYTVANLYREKDCAV